MAFLIGTDEAGYGPNLGPLVISATVWRVPDAMCRTDLYEVLQRVVRRTSADPGDARIAIADSKQLYKTGSGLAPLERGLLACLRTLGDWQPGWRDLWRFVAPDSEAALTIWPWNAEFETPIPREVPLAELDRLRALLAEAFQETGVSLQSIRATAVFPDRWNELLEVHSSKGEVLAHLTLGLLARTISSLEDAPVFVQCDKFGGRNRYGALLQHVFPDDWVEVLREGRSLSVYRWGPPPRRIECRFAAKGEEFLPAALASMNCKYLRELAMLAFNQFWARRIPGLRTTAGYPVDARRFKQDIAAVQRELGIDDRLIWRQK
jgi:hypothetical protein